MKLIIGGAYQGHAEYAAENYPGLETVTDFHMLVRDMILNGKEPLKHIDLKDYTDKIILCDDIFCGVTPLDALDRKWRQELGKVLALVSKESDEVVRVFCGLGVRLK